MLKNLKIGKPPKEQPKELMLSEKEAEISPTTEQKTSSQTMKTQEPTKPEEGFSPELAAQEPVSIEAPSHFDNLLNIPDTPAAQPVHESAATQSNFVSKDVFHNNICGGLSIAGSMAGLESLKTSTDDNAARASNDAIYEIILETPMFHFILNPQGKWVARITAILSFAVPKAMAVAAELEAKAAAAQPEKAGEQDVMAKFEANRAAYQAKAA